MHKTGVVLLLLGLGIFVIFGGVGLLKLIFSSDTPVFFRFAVLFVAVGAVLIVISLLREKWNNKDKYEEVER